MDAGELEQALAANLPAELAKDLASEFVEIRRDVATLTLGRGAPGKFVESTVQALQALENAGAYDNSPAVDKYLRELESRASSLPDGLRICASRLARSMYAIRSKRDIVHKGDVDQSIYDLKLLYAGSQWIITELLALSQGISGEHAASLVARVQLPAGELVEAIGDRRIVHGDMSIPEEVLTLLNSYYPTPVSSGVVFEALDRRARGSVANSLRDLWASKAIHRTEDKLLALTNEGVRQAVQVALRHAG